MSRVYSGADLPDQGDRTRELRRSAEEILRKAREDVRCRMEDAAARGRRKGFDEGLAAGLAAARQQTQEKLGELRERTQAECDRRCAEYREREAQAKAGTLRRAFGLAEQILDIELRHDDDAYLSLVRAAAPYVENTRQAALSAGPLGAEIAERRRQELGRILNTAKDVEIRISGEDDGRCVIETPDDSVDSSLSTQLRAAARALGLSGPPELGGVENQMAGV